MIPVDHLIDFSEIGDALVLAAVSSNAEFDLLNDWVEAQRLAHPDTKIEVLRLPGDGPSERLIAPARQFAQFERGTFRCPGAGVLGTWRPADAGQNRGPVVRTRHLPSAGVLAARHPPQRSVASTGRGR